VRTNDLKSIDQKLYYFDQDSAEYAVRFFGLLRHAKGRWAGQAFVLQPWQDYIVRQLFGWKRYADGQRMYRKAFIEVPRKQGKALALDTPLPTPNGWITMGDVTVGTTLFDERGSECHATAVTAVQYDRPVYRVSFSDGTSIVADAEHEWRVDCRRTGFTVRHRALETDRYRTTRQIAENVQVTSPSAMRFGERNYRVPVTGALDTSAAELPVAPYVLGAWLGDGNSASARITAAYKDHGIIERITACGVETHECASSNANSGLYLLGAGDRSQQARNGSVQAKLRNIGVLNDKHIPTEYLRAAIEQRRELLQGLMDTDGYVNRCGECEYTSTNVRLAEGVLELCRSLGYKPRMCSGRAMIYGRDCGP
jgi:hypothetical protein